MSSKGLSIFLFALQKIKHFVFPIFKDSLLSFSQRLNLSSSLFISLAFKVSVLLTNDVSSAKSVKLNKFETFAMSWT